MRKVVLTNKIASDKFAYLINQILYSLFTFSVTFFAARFLSMHNFGEFSYAYSFIALLNIVPLAFVYFPMMNFYSRWKKNESSYVCSNITINLILSIFLSGSLWAILYFTKTIPENIYLFILFYFVYQSYEFFRRLFIVKQEMKILNKLELIKLLLFILFLSALTFFNAWKVKYLIISLTIVIVFANFISFAYSKIKINTNPDLTKVSTESFSFGKWILMSNIVQNVSSNLFIYLSGILLTAESVARLNAPKLFLGVTTIFLLSMDNYYTPKIAKKRIEFKVNFVEEFKNIILELRFFYLIFFLGSLLITYYQDFILSLVFGEKYAMGENYLWGYILVGLIYSLTRPFLILFRVFENTKFLFQSSSWVLVLVLLITYPLMKVYGAFGGITAMIIGNLVQLLIFLVYLKRYDKRLRKS